MLKLVSFLAISVTSAAMITACTGGLGGPAKNPLCRPNITPPMSMDAKSAQTKLDVKPREKPAIAAGEYKYKSSQFYYRDYQRDAMIHMEHTINAKGESKVAILCIGGNGIGREQLTNNSIEDEITVISNLKVADSNNRIRITKKTFKFKLVNDDHGGFYPEVTDIMEEVEVDGIKVLVPKEEEIFLSEMYNGEVKTPFIQQAVYDSGAGNIEARAKLTDFENLVSELVDVRATKGFERWTGTSLTLVVPAP